MTSWVVTEIVSQEKKNTRAKVIQKFIHLAKTCVEMNNFQTTMQILSGLESAAVSRLKKTWNELGKSVTLADLKKKFQFDKNSKTYRDILSTVSGPCIPFLGKDNLN